MSTFTDGLPPSVTPEPADSGPERRRRSDDGAASGSANDWLQQEIQRRIAEKSTGSGGRHARREASARSNGQRRGADDPAGLAPAEAGGPVQPPPVRAHRPRIPDPHTTDPHTTDPHGPWSGPPTAEHPILLSDLPLPAAPARPAPPSGSAAARLLSPPPSITSPPGPAPGTQPGQQQSGQHPTATSPTSAAPTSAAPVSLPPAVAARLGRAAAVQRLARPATQEPPPTVVPEPGSAPDTGEVIWSASMTATPMPVAPAPPTAQPTQEPPVSASAPGTVSMPKQRSSTPGSLFDAPTVRVDDGSGEPDDDLPNKRVRVVLAERKGVTRPVRTVVDIQEGTGVGELLRSNLIGSQLTVALRFAVGAGLSLGVLPLLFALVPDIAQISILGIRLPWLVLGVLVYPFLLCLGWWHTRTAERVEQNFADHVQD